MRPLRSIAVAAVAVLAAGAASASDMRFAWIQVDSSVPQSGAVTRLAPGDTAVLEIRVDADAAGVRNVSISVAYDPELLRVSGYVRCPETSGNQYGAIGGCGVEGPNGFGDILFTPGTTVVDNEIGRTGIFPAECAPAGCGQFDHSFELAHLVFEVLGPPGIAPPVATAVEPHFEPGLSGIGNAMAEWSIPAVDPLPLLVVATPPAVPALPPAGIALLAVALLLAAISRAV